MGSGCRVWSMIAGGPWDVVKADLIVAVIFVFRMVSVSCYSIMS